MLNYDNFINGKFVPATGNGKMTVINPSDGKPICTAPDSTAADVNAAVDAAAVAQKEWAKRPAIQRAKALHAIADKIRGQVEPLARVITEEQGKTLGLARVEVVFTADYIDYMAEWARRVEGEIVPSDRPGETYINRENFEAMQGFHAGTRKSGIGGADGKHGLYEFTQTHIVYIQS
jgi:lactaldehyde dehydrogenase/glycolaldehyde dehydrogenase